MATASYYIADPDFTYIEPSDGSAENNLGFFASTGTTLIMQTSRTPSGPTATGNTGEICWDSNYIYVCISTNSWKRVAIANTLWL
jgi:hypothetical protein